MMDNRTHHHPTSSVKLAVISDLLRLGHDLLIFYHIFTSSYQPLLLRGGNNYVNLAPSDMICSASPELFFHLPIPLV